MHCTAIDHFLSMEPETVIDSIQRMMLGFVMSRVYIRDSREE
jgi:hypothetical protein